MSDAAPIIVSALFAPADQAWFDGLRRAHFPPERNRIAAHLTLFHHLPPSIGPELARRLGEATRSAPPAASLAGLMDLGRGTAIRIEAPTLAKMRADLAEAFADLLTPQDRSGWRPHVTIQNKVTPEAGRRLREELAGVVTPRPVAISAIATWFYRDGPWEEIGRYPFRS